MWNLLVLISKTIIVVIAAMGLLSIWAENQEP